MTSDPVLQTFLVESRELLQDMESALLSVNSAALDAETVNAIFRAAHTIKGSAGLCNLAPLVAFTHVLENVLDAARAGSVTLEGELIALLLSCVDHIGRLIDAVAAGGSDDPDALEADSAALLEQLRAYVGGSATGPQGELPAGELWLDDGTVARLDPPSSAEGTWHISLRFGRDVLKRSLDPLAFVHYLAELGSIAGIAIVPDALPCAAEFDPELCYLGFEIAFAGQTTKSAIEAAFELVHDDCSLRILSPNSPIADYVALIRERPEDPARLAQLLAHCGSVVLADLEAALAGPEPRAAVAAATAASAPEQPDGRGVVAATVATKQARARDLASKESRSVRVDADKLDRLIDLVGELTIAAASSNVLARRGGGAELQECTATLSSLVHEVRDSALSLRMIKIGASFTRFQRVVHDVSRELGKDIALVISGEETELDKTVVERIADPLTHLVRNAIDHGIEAPELRRARGKPAKGTLRLNAYHDSGSVVIEVSDDGGGLNREKILTKAVERGLVEPGRALSDEEIYGLIFEPGFSTADQVTNLSGRGVGMDVVKRNITALRGTVGIRSAAGVGTTMTVRLPLTLAIIDGFLLGVGKSMFVVPLEMVEECVELAAHPGHDFANLRGQVLPFIRLRELFAVAGAPARRQNIVVVKHAGRKVGLVVDALFGELQTVIKPLGKMFSHLKSISGSTILGTGDLALILDVPSLVQQASRTSVGRDTTCYRA